MRKELNNVTPNVCWWLVAVVSVSKWDMSRNFKETQSSGSLRCFAILASSDDADVFLWHTKLFFWGCKQAVNHPDWQMVTLNLSCCSSSKICFSVKLVLCYIRLSDANVEPLCLLHSFKTAPWKRNSPELLWIKNLTAPSWDPRYSTYSEIPNWCG